MASNDRARRASQCPVCHRRLPEKDEGPERGPKFAPMCSSRCKRIDLATWLGEGYRIAGESASESIEAAQASTEDE